jgi:hypothetical protein
VVKLLKVLVEIIPWVIMPIANRAPVVVSYSFNTK